MALIGKIEKIEDVPYEALDAVSDWLRQRATMLRDAGDNPHLLGGLEYAADELDKRNL